MSPLDCDMQGQPTTEYWRMIGPSVYTFVVLCRSGRVSHHSELRCQLVWLLSTHSLVAANVSFTSQGFRPKIMESSITFCSESGCQVLKSQCSRRGTITSQRSKSPTEHRVQYIQKNALCPYPDLTGASDLV